MPRKKPAAAKKGQSSAGAVRVWIEGSIAEYNRSAAPEDRHPPIYLEFDDGSVNSCDYVEGDGWSINYSWATNDIFIEGTITNLTRFGGRVLAEQP